MPASTGKIAAPPHGESEIKTSGDLECGVDGRMRGNLTGPGSGAKGVETDVRIANVAVVRDTSNFIAIAWLSRQVCQGYHKQKETMQAKRATPLSPKINTGRHVLPLSMDTRSPPSASGAGNLIQNEASLLTPHRPRHPCP